ncbi:MAG: hypothetical protein V4607_02170 [Pseudomonadota bacterium]
MGGKFLNIDTVTGRVKQFLGITTSAGVGDADKIVSTGADGRLDASLMPAGFGVDAASIQASETLAAGDVVNIHSASGDQRVRKADATSAGKEGDGFVVAGAASGANALVYFEGRISGLSDLVPGTRYYLSDSVPGGITDTPPNATGNVVQYIGRAISETEIAFEATDGIILA